MYVVHVCPHDPNTIKNIYPSLRILLILYHPSINSSDLHTLVGMVCLHDFMESVETIWLPLAHRVEPRHHCHVGKSHRVPTW